MNEYTLVVVDMQPGFPAANDRQTIAAVAAEIVQARHKNCPVIFLQVSYLSIFDMEDFLPTHRQLTNLLCDYELQAVGEKLQSDGSWAVQYQCQRHGFTVQRFRVCGVNTNACVKETVIGLAKILPESQIEVVANACNTASKQVNWNMWASLPQVSVVGLCPEAHLAAA